jgi:hypothetical protein
MTNNKTFDYGALLLVYIAAFRMGAGRAEEPPRLVMSALDCVVSIDFNQRDLAEIGLRPGDLAWLRFHIGSIPGMEPSPGEYQIFIYNNDQSRGLILLALPSRTGAMYPLRNGYRLTRLGVSWNADEGNGGLATYAAMSGFATKVFQSRRYRVRLKPTKQSCLAPTG